MHNLTRFLGRLLLLLSGAGLAGMSAVMLVWRSWMCAKMAQLNTAIAPDDLSDYLMQRIAQREVCGAGDYFSNMVGLFIGVVLASVAWSLIRNRHASAPPTNEIP